MGLKSYFSTKKLSRKFKSTTDTALLARQSINKSGYACKQLDLIQYNTSPGNSRLKTSQTTTTLSYKSNTPFETTSKVSKPLCTRDNPCTCWTFRSLPGSSSGASDQSEPSRGYASLPYIATQPRCTCRMASCNTRPGRSRIRTNPWLPLPHSPDSMKQIEDEVDGEFTRRFTSTAERQRRPEPRLSWFISEVEEIMREQLSPSACASPALGYRRTLTSPTDDSDSDSTLSLRSTPRSQSPNTASHPLTSPSEGYKSGLDDPADSLDPDDTVKLRSIPVRPQISELLTQSLYEPESFRNSCMSTSTLSLSGGGDSIMSTSITSSRTKFLHEKVRRICQSNTQLNEQMRLAKLETQLLTLQD